MSRIPDRRQEIAAFFAAHANHVHTRVARRARTAHHIVDDACAIAWTKLLRRPDVALNAHGRAWLITVAVHEAWRLQERRAHETPVGPFARGSTVKDGHAPEPVDDFGVDVETQAVDRAQHSDDLAAFLTLKPRERQTLYLQAVGYRYAEICEMTGFTYTAVISSRARQCSLCQRSPMLTRCRERPAAGRLSA